MKTRNVLIIVLLCISTVNVVAMESDSDKWKISDKWTDYFDKALETGNSRQIPVIARCYNINACTNGGRTLLHCAISRGNIKQIKELLKHKANVYACTDAEQFTPLHVAAKEGNEKIVGLLLQHYQKEKDKTKDASSFIDARATDTKSEFANYPITPLYYPASSGHIKVVKLLLNAGATIDDALIKKIENKIQDLQNQQGAREEQLLKIKVFSTIMELLRLHLEKAVKSSKTSSYSSSSSSTNTLSLRPFASIISSALNQNQIAAITKVVKDFIEAHSSIFKGEKSQISTIEIALKSIPKASLQFYSLIDVLMHHIWKRNLVWVYFYEGDKLEKLLRQQLTNVLSVANRASRIS